MAYIPSVASGTWSSITVKLSANSTAAWNIAVLDASYAGSGAVTYDSSAIANGSSCTVCTGPSISSFSGTSDFVVFAEHHASNNFMVATGSATAITSATEIGGTTVTALTASPPTNGQGVVTQGMSGSANYNSVGTQTVYTAGTIVAGTSFNYTTSGISGTSSGGNWYPGGVYTVTTPSSVAGTLALWYVANAASFTPFVAIAAGTASPCMSVLALK